MPCKEWKKILMVKYVKNIEYGKLETCPNCDSEKLVSIPLERHESWEYCNDCGTCWTHPMVVPTEEVVQQLQADGFESDAQKAEKGEPISKEGE